MDSCRSKEWGEEPGKNEEDGVLGEGACFHPHFGRQGACYDITKPADSQTNKNFSENNCMTAEFYKNVHPIKQTTSDSGS